MTRRVAILAVAFLALACSTGDPDPEPADRGRRIGRTTAQVDSALDPARSHIRTIDSLGAAAE